MAQFDAARIRRYYDRHTPTFVAHGQGGTLGAIHRAVWGPGVTSRRDAFRYVEDQIAALIERLRHGGAEMPHIVDLGCGVGGSLCYLAGRLHIRGTGVTLSPVQATMARRAIREQNLGDRVALHEGDYCSLPPGIATADLAYAIESFVHGPSPARFFAECRRLVRPGGLLVICDDMRRPAPTPAAARTIDRFCTGWHVNTLLTTGELRTIARGAGFEHQSTTDLSPFLEIHRTRDRLIGALVSLVRWFPGRRRAALGPLVGGHALQTCLARGWIGYDLAVFRRSASP